MENFIPEHFRETHDYCFFLHDQLLETLISCGKTDAFTIKFKFLLDEHAQEIEQRSGSDLIDWLRNNGYANNVKLLIYKEVVRALLSDYLHFLYEALDCSRKGKLTVTYALLRKPLKENLFYLEWLLASPREFLERYESGDSKNLAISRISEETKVKLIKNALEETRLGVWIEPQFVYDLRYSKSADLSFENYFQKANHLVTTFRFLETEPENFNFVFSDTDSLLNQWEGLYAFLPLLLFHAVQIVEALIGKIAKRATDGHDFVEVKTYLGLIKWITQGFWELKVEEVPMHILARLRSYTLICNLCESETNVMEMDLDCLYAEAKFICRTCQKPVSYT